MTITRTLIAGCMLMAIMAVIVSGASSTSAPTILSIDFGNEWIKGCLANAKSSTIGTHLDVVINEQSNRKTPNVLGFDNDNDRILGDSALPLLFRNPSKVFPHVKRLLGKTLADSATKQYMKDFGALELKSDERGTIVFSTKGGDLSVEEIIVMLLQLAKRQSENHVKANAEQADIGTVDEIVLTVPEHFTAAQRILFQQLVELAGFNTPKATLNELTAVAVDYAVRNLQGEGKKKIAFLGAGTMGSSANLVGLEKNADGSINVKVLSTASDETVGGYSFDTVLRDALAKKFDAAHQKSGASITTNARAMAKLLRESREIKEMLSVSPVIESNMEELFNGKDFKVSATQEEFIGWTADLASQLIQPLRDVLKDVEGVDGIELFGGAIRAPSVQAAIKTAFPAIALGKHVDGEEGALVGAAHYAGVLTNISKLTKVSIDETAVIKPKTAADEALILNSKQQKELAAKIAALDERAAQRSLADAARNGLESLLNDARDLSGKGAPKGKNDQHASLESMISEASTFVDDSDKKTTAAEFDAVRAKLVESMKPLQEPKKVEKETASKKDDKPSKPKKKRDRRAEHAKAQKEYEKSKQKENEAKKKADEKRKAEAEAKKKSGKKEAGKKETKKETKKEAPKKETPKKKEVPKKDAKKDAKKKSGKDEL